MRQRVFLRRLRIRRRRIVIVGLLIALLLLRLPHIPGKLAPDPSKADLNVAFILVLPFAIAVPLALLTPRALHLPILQPFSIPAHEVTLAPDPLPQRHSHVHPAHQHTAFDGTVTHRGSLNLRSLNAAAFDLSATHARLFDGGIGDRAACKREVQFEGGVGDLAAVDVGGFESRLIHDTAADGGSLDGTVADGRAGNFGERSGAGA